MVTTGTGTWSETDAHGSKTERTIIGFPHQHLRSKDEDDKMLHNYDLVKTQMDKVAGDPLQAIELEYLREEAEEERPSDIKDWLRIYNVKAKHLAERTGNDDVVENLKGLSQFGRWIINNHWFEPFIGSLVIVDVFLVALQVDYHSAAPGLFASTQFIIFFAFSFELLIRILADPDMLCSDRLLLFDILIMGISLLDVIFVLQGNDEQDVDLSFVIVLRVIRLARVLRIAKFMHLSLLRILMEAISDSLQPLALVICLASITVISFAIMMTTLVPLVYDDGVAVREAVLHYYRSVPRSSLSLVEAMSGASDWGAHVAFQLFQGARENKFGSIVMLMFLLLAHVVLRLGLNGLVTAVFLEQLFQASDKHDELAASMELVEQGELLRQFDKILPDSTRGDADLTWQVIADTIASNEAIMIKLGFTVEDLKELFLYLDVHESGAINVDSFVFAIFRLRAMSKSVDMLSIDYQQEKALQRISDLHHGLRHAIAGIQSRLTALFLLLPVLEDEIASVRRGLEEIQDLEVILQEKRDYRETLRANGGHGVGKNLEEDDMSSSLSVDDLRGTFKLNRRLMEVEALAEEVFGKEFYEASGDRDSVAAASSAEQQLSAHHIGMVADSIVQSVQLALQQEMAAVRVANAEAKAQAHGYPTSHI